MDLILFFGIIFGSALIVFLLVQFFKNKFLMPDISLKGDVEEYLQYLEKGKFKDKFCYGISDKKRGFLILDPVLQPGALYCGGMGSGKSISMRFTLVTHVAVNSENTVYLLMDALKAMTDYQILFDGQHIDTSSNVITALKDDAKIVPLIEVVHNEAMLRKDAFAEIGANHIYEYERKMKKKNPNDPGLARIVIALEEFHVIPNSQYVKFQMKVDQPGSIADKLKILMRIGRSYGIFFLFATQRATGDDIPTQLRPGITMMMCFKMNNPGEAAGMNLPHAQEITMEQRGRCAYEEGFIQFPFLPDEAAVSVLKKYYKPLQAKLLGYDVPQIRSALAEGMVNIKPLLEVLTFSNQYSVNSIATRILNTFKYEVSVQPNVAYVAELVAEKYGKKYAVKIVATRNDLASQKEIDALKKGADYLGCEGVIVIGIEQLNSHISRLEQTDPAKFKVLDPDDLKNIGRMVDNKKDLDAKNTYSDIYLGFAIADERDLFTNKSEILNDTEYDLNDLEKTGIIKDPKKMKEIIFIKKAKINGLDDDGLSALVKSLNISESTKFIDYSFLKEKKLTMDIHYMRELLKDNNTIIIGMPDSEKIRIQNEELDLVKKKNEDSLNDFFGKESDVSLNTSEITPIEISNDLVISIMEKNIKEKLESKEKAKKQRNSLNAAKKQVEDGDKPVQIVNLESVNEIRERLRKAIALDE